MFGRKNAVGVDIGSHSIKVCLLSESGRGLFLKRFDVAPLPPDSVVDGAVMNFPQVQDKLKELVAANKLKGRPAVLSISGHSVIVKKISLPEMTQQELDASIMWEAEQYIPFDIKEVNVDVQILDPKAGQGQMDVLLVAAKKDIINDYASIAVEAGLEPSIVDVDTFAGQNMFELNYGFPPNETIAIINVGASMININIISNGITQFTRDISMGGALLTEEIQRQLGVSYEEAEHYKIGGTDSISSSAVFKEVQRLSDRVAGTLVTEIQRSVEFFKATSVGEEISRVYLSGGAAQMAALIRLIEQRLEVPAELVNPFKNIVIDTKRFDIALLQKIAPSAGVVVGLALRRPGDK
ncbi:MAG: type IV pilus assembly protein PilM [Deltaproteobacteria bacterium]|nr:type IV pilus assembly protein PilM [Deltaproteobacteria bacterium]